jgi:hypothetical protein
MPAMEELRQHLPLAPALGHLLVALLVRWKQTA